MASVVGEASSSTPPSTSIPPPRLCTYNVFLSFYGKETRNGFTDHMCAALERKGITTYRDDKNLEKGEVIKDELLKAIEESMFAVTVLSPNYASSTWCLDELQKIVECKNNLGLEIVPVFYGVEPSHVRYQKGSFEEAFKKHEERFGQGSDKIKRWKDALTQIANYSGWDSKDQREARLVESIAVHIDKKLIPKLPSCSENHIGIASRVEAVVELIGIGLNDVRFVGIQGMGGIGKTTIARIVYETIKDKFEVSCFMRNVRELSKSDDFVPLQRDLLSRLNINSDKFYDVEDGRKKIKSSLCNKKVLLVLDDVNREIQLKNLAEKQDWFGPGSRIIITSRDKQLLNTHEVHGTYEVKGLDQEEACQLFCLKAFRQPQPKEGYLGFSKEVVKYTKGLPLAIDVLGSHLYKRDDEFWDETINEIRNGQHLEIFENLKISYDHLTLMEKNIFLDIACFFKGEKKDEVIRTLKMCELYVRIGSAIVTLKDKSLITLDDNNRLEMHDLLQEMGRHIVYEESPNNPGKRSRLWSKNDIDRVLTNNMGTEKIRGMALTCKYDARRWSPEAFSKISQLKLLILEEVGELPFGLNGLPTSLKVLRGKHCSLETLPLSDEPYEVVEMKLRYFAIKQLWRGKKFLEKLKYLDLSDLHHLERIPDLTGVPNLETLILEFCYSLTEVHPSLVRHQKLILLKLSVCPELKTLPGKLEMCSLKELIIENCKKFENLPAFGKCMKNLSKLSLRSISVKKLPKSLGCLVGLELLSLWWCSDLVCLPDVFDELKSLKELDAGRCPCLRGLPPSVSRLPLLRTINLNYCVLPEGSFPHDFCYFPSLINLNLLGCDFMSVPISIPKLPKLGWLQLSDCSRLQFLPELPSSIRALNASGCTSLLNTSESNILSTVCNVFKSPSSQDQARIFQMMISGKEIPTLFGHQQDGNRVSVPNPRNCPRKERMGIALCFLLHKFSWQSIKLSLFRNGNTFISCWKSYDMRPGSYLYILCLTNDYLNDEFHGDNCFELSVTDYFVGPDRPLDDNPYDDNLSANVLVGVDESTRPKILKSSWVPKILKSSWVRIENIEDLNKSGTERPKRKKTRSVILEQKHCGPTKKKIKIKKH